jgi:hypothetical protein
VNGAAKADMINHPPHYKGDGVECIEVIKRYDLGFLLGNAAKYLIRAGRKDDERADRGKAVWYVRHWLEDPETHRPWSPCIDQWMSPDLIASAFGLTGARRGLLVAILDVALSLQDQPAEDAVRAALAVFEMETAP